ncbi:hypothetical protein E2C01_071182 [Portunus trituberculatus]|uniref:Uncharacterized protein n=1 Tax=Portunus trituberculatus TaxID=210409 RepID=A0A5B7I7K0_PORTR|nr:hypothetical protein [Portunus trituberculatus]
MAAGGRHPHRLKLREAHTRASSDMTRCGQAGVTTPRRLGGAGRQCDSPKSHGNACPEPLPERHPDAPWSSCVMQVSYLHETGLMFRL